MVWHSFLAFVKQTVTKINTSMNRIDDVTAHATNASTHHAKAIINAASLKDARGMSKADHTETHRPGG